MKVLLSLAGLKAVIGGAGGLVVLEAVRRRSALPALALALVLVSPDGYCALGKTAQVLPLNAQDLSMVNARRQSSLSSVPDGRYTEQVVLLENGTTVREYVTLAGLVFAVAWQGPVLPDLRSLLGDYFPIFDVTVSQAIASGRRGQPVRLERDGLVVHSSGRMRNFYGQAYAPALVPSGVVISNVLP